MLVETKYGKVKGVQEGPVQVWRGVPFAQAPRFRAPLAPEPWAGVRDASRFGPVAWQVPGPGLLESLSEPVDHQDEDCLNLNVWSPDTDGRSRPVLVWIHGGAFVWGSGQTPWYDGTSFAANGDVVVVTINYRLGPFGFLHTLGDANCGILDQAAALRWVRENIAAFGGDPGRVTVAGESAGSISVGLLLRMPEARGLFQQAIMESGAAAPGFLTDRTRTEAKVRSMGIPPEQLEKMPAADLLAAGGPRTEQLAWLPLDEGLVEPAPVPLLIGTNRDEFMLYAANPAWAAMDDETLLRAAGPVTPALRSHYLEGRHGRDLFQAVMRLTTDRGFWYPTQRMAENHPGATWVYRFDWDGGPLKACHALEIPFVFNTIDLPGGSVLSGCSPDRPLIAAQMHRAWTAFLRDGDPGWPPYDVTRRPAMLFNVESDVADDPAGDARRAWASAG